MTEFRETERTAADLDEETLFLVAQTFKALSDPTRIRILHLLSQGTCCKRNCRKAEFTAINSFPPA